MNQLTIKDFNPYKGLRQDDNTETARVNAYISRADYDLIKTVCPIWGTLQAIVSQTIYSIVNELRQSNITEYNPTILFDIVRRHTDPGIVEQRPQPTNTARTNGVCGTTPRSSSTSSARSGTTKRGRPVNATNTPNQFTLNTKTADGLE